MIALLLLVNLGISWLNAWACGKTWNESRHSGGIPHFMNWAGATMSACGFSWCYLLAAGAVGSVIRVGEGTEEHLLVPPHVLDAFMSLGYLAILLPILGSGIAITVHAWGVAYRERSFGSTAVAAYNTWAQIYNVGEAVEGAPRAAASVAKLFDADDADSVWGPIVFALAAAALAGGALTTRAIIRSTAKSTAQSRSAFAPG